MPSENWKALQAQLGITSKPKPKAESASPAPPHTRFKKKRKREDDSGATKTTKTAADDVESRPKKPTTGLHIQANPTPVLALDAEMVLIKSGRSPAEQRHPARVSIVNTHSFTVADMFIRIPTGTYVHDYVTEHSGIKPGDLDREDAVTLEDARKFLSALLKDKKVVGHALWNDFEVLGINIPREDVRDTARLRSLKNGKGLRKLKDIAREVCGVKIQGGSNGHDSVSGSYRAYRAVLIFNSGRGCKSSHDDI